MDIFAGNGRGICHPPFQAYQEIKTHQNFFVYDDVFAIHEDDEGETRPPSK
jgi:hypothetical protein